MKNFLKFWLMASFLPRKLPNFDHFHQKCPILTKLTPLMTFLTKYMSINLTEIILETFRETIIWPLSPNFDIRRHFGPTICQNDTILTICTKMTHFHQINPINYIFDQSYATKPHWENFYTILVEKLKFFSGKSFCHFRQILTSFLPPKNESFLAIFVKMTYFDYIDPINDIFY